MFNFIRIWLVSSEFELPFVLEVIQGVLLHRKTWSAVFTHTHTQPFFFFFFLAAVVNSGLVINTQCCLGHGENVAAGTVEKGSS